MATRHTKPRGISLAVVGLFALTVSGLVESKRTPDEQRWKAWEQHRSLLESSPFKGVSWRSIGPSVQGGRVLDIEIAPNDPNTIYVAYASGGLWKSENNGQSFAPLSDALPSAISGDLAVDKNNPDLLWYGTGEPNASRSSYSGLGVFKSTDGGKSFAHAGLAGADRIARVIIDPTDSQHILVAVQGALYSKGGMRGVYQTRDGGKNWAQTLKTANGSTGATDLIFHSTNPRIVYAATWDHLRSAWDFRGSGAGSAIYKSADAGATFTLIKSFNSLVRPGAADALHVGRIGLAVSAAKPDVLYASVDHQGELPLAQQELGDQPLSPNRLLNMSKEQFLALDLDVIEAFVRSQDLPETLTAAQLLERVKSGAMSLPQLRERLKDGNSSLFDSQIRALELYRSDDRGDSWRKTHDAPIREFTYTYGYYFGKLGVSPVNADHVVLLGVPLAESIDGGKTFSGRLNDPDVHVDYHVWRIDPANPKRIFAGNDGGIDVSYDSGAHWQRLDRQAVGQSYAVAFDMNTPYNVYTGMQDNGTYKGANNAEPDDLSAWTFLNGGDGMQIQVDPRDSAKVYTGYQFGNYQSADGKRVRAVADLDSPSLRYNWQSPILLSPHNPDVVYLGANKLFRSMLGGKNMEAISGDLTRSTKRGNVPFATITSISESPKQFGLLWAGTDDGQLWVSDDAGARWRDVGAKLPDAWISRVEASKFARFRAYVSINDYRNDNQTAMLYTTDDLGSSWRSISAGLPNSPINVVREDPLMENVLYVGTDRGVYVSKDRGKNWHTYGHNLPTVAVHDLVIHPRERELIVGTHGRSVWIADALPLQEMSALPASTALHGFYIAPIQFQRFWRNGPSIWFDRPKNAPKATLSYMLEKPVDLQLAIKTEQGEVLREIKLSGQAGVNQFDWDLRVDLERAIAFEQASAQKTAGAASKATPYQDIKTFGWPAYLQPGKYLASFQSGTLKHDVSFEVKAPEPFKPRVTPLNVRGK